MREDPITAGVEQCEGGWLEEEEGEEEIPEGDPGAQQEGSRTGSGVPPEEETGESGEREDASGCNMESAEEGKRRVICRRRRM